MCAGLYTIEFTRETNQLSLVIWGLKSTEKSFEKSKKNETLISSSSYFWMVSSGYRRPDGDFDGLVFGDVAESFASAGAAAAAASATG